jgi:hypothetical protein
MAAGEMVPAAILQKNVAGFRVEAQCFNEAHGKSLILELPPTTHHDDDVLFQPILIGFSDGSQPVSTARLVLTLPEEIDFGRKIQLQHWTPENYARGNDPDILDSRVLISLSDRKTLCTEVSSFDVFAFRLGTTQITVPNIKGNKKFDRTYDDDRENRVEYDRGGFPYFLPAGFTRKGLKVHFEGWENQPNGCHGCSVDVAQKIINDGFKLPSEMSGVKDGHIGLSKTVFGVENWADGIFCSPSHKYCMAGHYGGHAWKPISAIHGKGLFVDSTATAVDEAGEDLALFCILQCKMHKDFLTRSKQRDRRFKGRVFAGTSGPILNNCDQRVDRSTMEFRITSGDGILPYGLLLRTMPLKELDDFFRDPTRL